MISTVIYNQNNQYYIIIASFLRCGALRYDHRAKMY